MTVKETHGLTLIELIVVVTIVILFSGASLAAYFNFSQNQTVANDTRNWITTLRKVQAMSKNLVYPPSCTGLVGYRIFDDCGGVYDESCQFINSSALCSGGGEIPVSVNEKVFEEAYFSEPFNVIFIPGSGGLSTPVSFAIAEMGNIVVSIDENGNITTN